MDFFRIEGSDIILSVKAVPGASKTECAGVKDGRLRIRVAAAPEDGRANRALCAFLADALNLSKRDVVLIAGEKSREKRLRLPARCASALQTLASENSKA